MTEYKDLDEREKEVYDAINSFFMRSNINIFRFCKVLGVMLTQYKKTTAYKKVKL